MATGDTPMMASSTYSSNAYNLESMQGRSALDDEWTQQLARRALFDKDPVSQAYQRLPLVQGKPMSIRRVVQIFIADPNENIPLEDCMLHESERKLTDATDQELFFELDIKGILEKHNAKRTKVIDKKVKDRTEYLEPAKVRDLKMVVVTVATL
jgi:hypothetical protein